MLMMQFGIGRAALMAAAMLMVELIVELMTATMLTVLLITEKLASKIRRNFGRRARPYLYRKTLLWRSAGWSSISCQIELQIPKPAHKCGL
jgi:hypothetical protein